MFIPANYDDKLSADHNGTYIMCVAVGYSSGNFKIFDNVSLLTDGREGFCCFPINCTTQN